jgi:hypothetical protein
MEKDVIEKIRHKASIGGFLLWIGMEHPGRTLSESQFKAAKLLVSWIRDGSEYMRNAELAMRNLNSYASQIMSNRDKGEMIPLFLSYLSSLDDCNSKSTRNHLDNAAHNKRR